MRSLHLLPIIQSSITVLCEGILLQHLSAVELLWGLGIQTRVTVTLNKFSSWQMPFSLAEEQKQHNTHTKPE